MNCNQSSRDGESLSCVVDSHGSASVTVSMWVSLSLASDAEFSGICVAGAG